MKKFDWNVELPKAATKFETQELERYVNGKRLNRGCALQRMHARGDLHAMRQKYGGSISPFPSRRQPDGDVAPSSVIEALYEDWWMSWEYGVEEINRPLSRERRQAIYDAFVLELARRRTNFKIPTQNSTPVQRVLTGVGVIVLALLLL